MTSPLDKPSSTTPKYVIQYHKSQEKCKDLLLTLPRERGWISSHLYKYQDFWYLAHQLEGTIACQQHFQAQDGDIFLVTTPKSGTTWFKALIHSLVNRNRHPIDQHHPLYTFNPHDLVRFLELSLYTENPTPDFSIFTPPRVFCSHLPYASLPKSVYNSNCKLVYVCRDPKDTFVSLWHFSNKLRVQNMLEPIELDEALELFCRGISISGPFWDHALSYWKECMENPRKILLLKFEDMINEPVIQLKRLAEFLQCPFSIEEEKSGLVEDILKLCSFSNLSNLEVNRNGKLPTGEENGAFFRRGEVGDWRNHLKPEMAGRLDSITVKSFQGSGFRI